MKISKETIEVLKNFSAINPNLVIKEGNNLSTIADAKNIMASVVVKESFDSEVGIYDLNEFLSALNLIDDPDLNFGENSVFRHCCKNMTLLSTRQSSGQPVGRSIGPGTNV